MHETGAPQHSCSAYKRRVQHKTLIQCLGTIAAKILVEGVGLTDRPLTEELGFRQSINTTASGPRVLGLVAFNKTPRRDKSPGGCANSIGTLPGYFI